jgi:hypothetical protein
VTTLESATPRTGVTHLIIDGNLVSLLKCPFCKSFRNVYVLEMNHHVKFTHPGRSYRVSDFYPKDVQGSSPYSPYILKEEIKLPWINCLWCNYRDKIEFDLSLHFLEEHKEGLLAIPITRRERLAAKALIRDPCARFFSKFETPMEFRLDKAVKVAKEKGDIGNA